MTRSGRNFLEVSLPATSRDSIHPDKTGNRKGSTLHTEETELMNDKLPPCADTRVERVRLKDGDYFFPAEPAIKADSLRTKSLLHRFNHTDPAHIDSRLLLMKELLPECGEGVSVTTSFHCSRGYNIRKRRLSTVWQILIFLRG